MVNSQFATHAELFDLSGKRGLVTGGTKGTADVRVVISSRNAEACARAQEQLSEFGDVRAVPADLPRHEGCERLSRLVTADSGSLDILVNNAGAMWGRAAITCSISHASPAHPAVDNTANLPRRCVRRCRRCSMPLPVRRRGSAMGATTCSP